jgi:hydroxymethylbilane synthase
VHSLKDVPMELEPGFALPAILEREDPADAFVSNEYANVDALPQGARVGTSSLRRQSQLRALRPDLELRDLRGNVGTRLAKLDAGDYDAIVLACAGLKRLGFDARIRARLDAPRWLPAPAQGAIAIECREDDAELRMLLSVLDHADTRVRAEAERAMNRALHGSCHVPVAAYARLEGEHLSLSGLVGSASDGRIVRAEAKGRGDAPECIGLEVAELLLAQGARGLIDAAL